ncbi:MAG: hypothetical protein ACTSPW_14455, partial [Promethearchaeota archaeon]
MDAILIVFYTFLTILYFIAFSVLITILGGIILFIILKKEKSEWDIGKLEYCLLSYAIGISIYLIISYILDIFLVFNIYFGYFLVIKESIQNNNTKIYKIILFSIVIFFIILRFFPLLALSSSLPAEDPFAWTVSIFYLLDHQHINYDLFRSYYPCGFTFINAGTLLIAPSKTVAFFYMKFGFIPYLFLLILCLYSILIQFFKDNLEYIFFCIFLMLSYNYLLQRTIIFLPSLIVNILILISILILTTKIPNYLLGFTIPAMFLM